MIILGRDSADGRNGMCEAGKLLVYSGSRQAEELELNVRGRSGCA